MNHLSRTAFDRLVFWLFLIPGTCLSIAIVIDVLIDWNQTLWHRDPQFVIGSIICSAALSIIGAVAIIKFIQRSEWRILAIIAAVCGTMIFGEASINNLVRHWSTLSFLDIASIILAIWCVVVIFRLSYEIKHNG